MEDEPGQMEDIYHFADRRPGIPESLPNLPGYHFLVISLTPGHPTVRSARLVTLASALCGLFIFAGAWRRLHGQPAGAPTLLFALLPIAQPFTAMVYTDVPSLTFVMAALWAHFSNKQKISAALFLLACFVRQTNLVWIGYVFALEALNAFFPLVNNPANPPPRRAFGEALAQLWRRGCWLFLLLVMATVIILYAGRLTLGTAHGNRLEPNLATIHFGAVLLLLLGLPVWIACSGGALPLWANAVWKFPTRTLGLTALGIGVAFIFAATYSNPHVWNRELFWRDPSSTYILLRNWPLVWIDRLKWLRGASGLLIVTLGTGMALFFEQQRFKRELWLSIPFAGALLLTNGLVEPRYFITPCAVLLLFLEFPSRWLLWQISWFGLLCLVHAPFIMRKLSLW